jgi:hypothetical protein
MGIATFGPTRLPVEDYPSCLSSLLLSPLTRRPDGDHPEELSLGTRLDVVGELGAGRSD